jgi:hypothetical protein
MDNKQSIDSLIFQAVMLFPGLSNNAISNTASVSLVRRDKKFVGYDFSW